MRVDNTTLECHPVDTSAWHRPLSSITHCEHLNLWKFIECLQNEEYFIHCPLMKINSGAKIEPNNSRPTILQQPESLARNL